MIVGIAQGQIQDVATYILSQLLDGISDDFRQSKAVGIVTNRRAVSRYVGHGIQAVHAQTLNATIGDLAVKTRHKQHVVFITQRLSGANAKLSGNFQVGGFIAQDLLIAFVGATATREFNQPELFDLFVEQRERFLDYAEERGAHVAGASSVQGEAPKYLLAEDHAGMFHAEGALPDDIPAGKSELEMVRGGSKNGLSDPQIARRGAGSLGEQVPIHLRAVIFSLHSPEPGTPAGAPRQQIDQEWRPLLKTEQFKANGKPGYKFCCPVAKVSDRIVDIVLQSTASGNAFVEFLGVGLENRSCFPTVIKKYLNMTIHSSL